MALMTWNDQLSVGVRAIDSDHKKLISIANDLHYGIQAGQSKAALTDILAGLAHFTQVHSSREETLLAARLTENNDPHAAAHKKEHQELAAWVLETQARNNSAALRASSLPSMDFLKVWLQDHIQGSANLYSAHL
jgi:hemerythrin-like metal-binding protein